MPLKGLKIINFLGVFYYAEDTLMVSDEAEGTRDVLAEVLPYAGQDVRLLMHHRPPVPHDPTKWGGGSCLMERTGFCPFGHHEDPLRAFHLDSVGVLELLSSRCWVLQTPSAKQECLVHLLEGHRGQLVITTFPDLDELDERIRDLDPSRIKPTSLEEMIGQLGEMKDLLETVNRMKDEIDD